MASTMTPLSSRATLPSTIMSTLRRSGVSFQPFVAIFSMPTLSRLPSASSSAARTSRHAEAFARLHRRALVPRRIAGLADRQRHALRWQRLVLVNELAFRVGLAELLVVQLDDGVGDRRSALVHGQGEVPGRDQVGLDRIVIDDLAV